MERLRVPWHNAPHVIRSHTFAKYVGIQGVVAVIQEVTIRECKVSIENLLPLCSDS